MSLKRRILSWGIGLFCLFFCYSIAKETYYTAIDGELNAFVAWRLFRNGLAFLGWLFLGIFFFMVDGIELIIKGFKIGRRAKRIRKIRKNKEKNMLQYNGSRL